MKSINEAGFTIIETMLFLGITGLLIIGVLVGAGTSINIQRYRDSVMSFQSILQQQYSEVSNVSNDSESNTCNGIPDNLRGQSNCVILGRYITTIDSQKLSIKSVIGIIPATPIISTNDIDVLNDYAVQIAPNVNSETYDIEWGSSLVRPGGDTEMAFSMLVLRAPSSGIVRTFIEPDAVIADSDIETLVSQEALMESVKTCVNSNGLFTGVRSAVVVMPNSSSASGIETLGEATSGC